jgi:hypothetical protein
VQPPAPAPATTPAGRRKTGGGGGWRSRYVELPKKPRVEPVAMPGGPPTEAPARLGPELSGAYPDAVAPLEPPAEAVPAEPGLDEREASSSSAPAEAPPGRKLSGLEAVLVAAGLLGLGTIVAVAASGDEPAPTRPSAKPKVPPARPAPRAARQARGSGTKSVLARSSPTRGRVAHAENPIAQPLSPVAHPFASTRAVRSLPAPPELPYPDRARIVEKMVRCGKENCTRCPHGPYLYAAWEEGEDTLTHYIGKKRG